MGFLLVASTNCDAFTIPTSPKFGQIASHGSSSSSSTSRSMAIDPSAFHMDSITNAFSLLADLDPSAVADAAPAADAVSAAAPAAADVATAAAAAAPSTSGP